MSKKENRVERVRCLWLKVESGRCSASRNHDRSLSERDWESESYVKEDAMVMVSESSRLETAGLGGAAFLSCRTRGEEGVCVVVAVLRCHFVW